MTIESSNDKSQAVGEKQTPYSLPASGESTGKEVAVDRWWLKFLLFGVLMALPIPFINYLWLLLGIYSGRKIGFPNGLIGIVIQIGTAFVVYQILATIFSW